MVFGCSKVDICCCSFAKEKEKDFIFQNGRPLPFSAHGRSQPGPPRAHAHPRRAPTAAEGRRRVAAMRRRRRAAGGPMAPVDPAGRQNRQLSAPTSPPFSSPFASSPHRSAAPPHAATPPRRCQALSPPHHSSVSLAHGSASTSTILCARSRPQSRQGKA
jgi:hypothetical protein